MKNILVLILSEKEHYIMDAEIKMTELKICLFTIYLFTKFIYYSWSNKKCSRERIPLRNITKIQEGN